MNAGFHSLWPTPLGLHHWPQAQRGMAMQVALNGLGFQTSRSGAFHDVHTHGNCSWSGVYCVQVDEPALRVAHIDVPPVPGQLLLFPSWLAHQALPYGGQAERVVIAFNASIHAAGGSGRLRAYSPT